MPSFFFAVLDSCGYGIIRIEADELTPVIESEAKQAAKRIMKAEPLETGLCISEALSFQTDEKAFSFAVHVAPDRQSASYRISIDGQIVESETLRV
jgi:hypothetical protein